LTPLGLTVLPRARTILAEVTELTHQARAARRPLCGTLRLGAIPTIGPFLLPRLLPRLHQAFGELRLYVIEDFTSRLLDGLAQGEIDAALVALPYDCGAVDTVILFQDPLVLALPSNHPLTVEPKIRPQQLQSESLILLKDGHCLRGHALAACGSSDRRQTAGFEASSLYTLVQLVESGLGPTLLPRLAVEAGLLRGTSIVTRPLCSDKASRQVSLVWRRGTGRRREFEVLAEELAQTLKQAPDGQK
jgi:LysR family hydrogen peroxide-inducible transcriptional activator